MYSPYLRPLPWNHGSSYAKHAIVIDGKFEYISKNDIQISLVPPSEDVGDVGNWINVSKDPSAVVKELEEKIKKWKLNKQYSEIIEELESILYE